MRLEFRQVKLTDSFSLKKLNPLWCKWPSFTPKSPGVNKPHKKNSGPNVGVKEKAAFLTHVLFTFGISISNLVRKKSIFDGLLFLTNGNFSDFLSTSIFFPFNMRIKTCTGIYTEDWTSNEYVRWMNMLGVHRIGGTFLLWNTGIWHSLFCLLFVFVSWFILYPAILVLLRCVVLCYIVGSCVFCVVISCGI